MCRMPEKITFALPEQIGNTDLFVGRKKEIDHFVPGIRGEIKRQMGRSSNAAKG